MARKIITVTLTCLSVVGVGAICYTLGLRSGLEYSKNYNVTVWLVNQANQDIKELRITGPQYVILLENIRKNQTEKVGFPVHGESSYKVKILFANNTMLESTERYVESGYTVQESITNEEIEAQY